MSEIEKLIEVSRKYGGDSRYVIAGGGNTSFKTADRLWVKASGHALATITEDGFAVLDRALLNPMGEKKYSDDTTLREEQVKNDLAAACLTKDRRPSVETSMHNCLEAAFVVHLHPTLVNGLMCSKDAAETCAKLFPDALYIPYTDPGYTLFKKVYDKIKEYRKGHGSDPKVIFLQNHGIFVGADTTKEIEDIYASVMSKLEGLVKSVPEGNAPICDCVSETIPAIRTILSRYGRGLKTLKVTNNALVSGFIESKEKAAAEAGRKENRGLHREAWAHAKGAAYQGNRPGSRGFELQRGPDCDGSFHGFYEGRMVRRLLRRGAPHDSPPDQFHRQLGSGKLPPQGGFDLIRRKG